MANKIFVNYRRDDARDITARIRDRLALAFGDASVFMDVTNLIAGQRFDAELARALSDTGILLAVIGPKWASLLAQRAAKGQQDFVREEIAEALRRGIVVIPVLIEQTSLPRSEALPGDIRDLVLHQKLVVTYEQFDRDIAELVRAIRFAKRNEAHLKSRAKRRAVSAAFAQYLSRVGLAATACTGLVLLGWLGSVALFPELGPVEKGGPRLASAWIADYRAAAKFEEEARITKAARQVEDARKAAEQKVLDKKRADDARVLAETQTAEKKLAEDARKQVERAALDKRQADEARMLAQKQTAEKKLADEARKLVEQHVLDKKRAEELRMLVEKQTAEKKLATEARKLVEQQALDKKRADDARALVEKQIAEKKLADDASKLVEQQALDKKLADDARVLAEQRLPAKPVVDVGVETAALATPQPRLKRDTWSDVAAGSGRAVRDTKVRGDPCPQCPQMVVLPKGEFLIGSTSAEIEAVAAGRRELAAMYEWEAPQHKVVLSQPLAVGRSHITRSEFAAYVNATHAEPSSGCYVLHGDKWALDGTRSWRAPGFEQTDQHPAVCISWNEATDYARWLGSVTGQHYRLMSEAEAEYAARAVTTAISTPNYSFGGDVKNLCSFGNGMDSSAAAAFKIDNSGGAPCSDNFTHTAPVASFQPNAWGVYDVHGNVWTWTADCWNERHLDGTTGATARTEGDCQRRVVRGGSWGNSPAELRSAARDANEISIRSTNLGFRVVRDLVN